MSRSGQAGIEYIIMIGVLLFFFIPIVYYSLTQATTAVKMSQVENIVNRLGKAADAVYALGPGAREIIPITVPEGVLDSFVGCGVPEKSGCLEQERREILLRVTGSGSVSDVHISTRANLTGELPKEKGTYFIKIETLPNSTVNITKR